MTLLCPPLPSQPSAPSPGARNATHAYAECRPCITGATECSNKLDKQQAANCDTHTWSMVLKQPAHPFALPPLSAPGVGRLALHANRAMQHHGIWHGCRAHPYISLLTLTKGLAGVPAAPGSTRALGAMGAHNGSTLWKPPDWALARYGTAGY